MEKINTVARKWGDSLAVIIPREIVRIKNISHLDSVEITIERKTDLRDLFGKLKTKKTAQQLKDESRDDWN